MNEIREKRIKSYFNALIWHKNIPFKASFLNWRALNGKLPSNERLINFGIKPTNCVCSRNRSGSYIINHIFNNGDLAVYVWKRFVTRVGVKTDHRSVKQRITQWWTMKHNNECHKLILHATPILICWNLWKNRCACKYRAKISNNIRVRYAIDNDNYKLIISIYPEVNWPPTWCGIIQLAERSK